MEVRLIEPLKIQHEVIETITYPIRKDGKIGKAIKAIAIALVDHFDKEDEIVVPLFDFFRPKK